MFLKDLFRLIKTSLNRFIFLLCIVLIGVGFLMGLLATDPIMEESVNDLYISNNYRDLKVYSNYGFSREDLNAILNEDYVEDAFASKEKDAYIINSENKTQVARFLECYSDINKVNIVEGRFPIYDNECIVSNEHSASLKDGNDQLIGTYIEAYLIDDDIDDYLKHSKFKIVGTFDSPEFMSKILTTSNIDNKPLENAILINNSNFISKYYTCINIRFKDSNNYNAFSSEYEEFSDAMLDKFDIFSEKQKEVCKNDIIADAFEEIHNGEKELEEERIKGQKELDDALKELEDAKKKIVDGEKEIKENEDKLWDAQNEIDKGWGEISENSIKVNDGIKQVEAISGQSFDETRQNTTNAYNNYLSLKANKHTLEDNIALLESNKTNAEGLIAMHNGLLTPMDHATVLATLAITDPASQTDLYQTLYMLDQAFTFLESYDATKTMLTNNLALVDGGINTILSAFGSEANLISTYNNLNTLANGKNALLEAEGELNIAQEEVNDGFKELNDAKEEIRDAKIKYEDGLKEYEDGLKEFNEKIADARKEIDDAYKEIDDLEEAKWITLDRSLDYSHTLYKGSCHQIDKIAKIMPLLFILVGMLVCVTTMTRLIQEQRTQIGVYRALGFSKTTVIFKYICYVGIASLLGSIIGVVVGMAIFPTVIYNTWRLMYILPSMKVVVPVNSLIISLVSFTAIMSIVTYFVARNTLKERPSDLLRPKAPKTSKPILLEKIKVIWNNLSFTNKVTFRNIFRYKARFFMTVIGVAGCTGLLVLGYGIKDSISDVVEVQYNKFYQYDYTANMEDDITQKDVNDAEIQINAMDGIENASKFLDYSGKVYINNIEKVLIVEVFNIDDFNKCFDLLDYQTDELVELNNKGVIITEKFANDNKIKVGDTITLESKEGTLKDVEVVQICKTYFRHYLYISDDLYHNLFNETYIPNNIAITYDGDLSYLEKTIENENISSITDFSAFIAAFEQMIESLDFIVLVIILTAGSLAFVVLFNLIAVNIAERLREIATLKVLGFRKNEIQSYIFKEIVLLTIIGALIGLVLGYYEVQLVMNIINVDEIMFSCDVRPLSYIYSFSITIVFTIIVLLFTKKTLYKVQMVESLKSIE